MQATILLYQIIMLDYFRFGLIFIKKISKPVFFKLKLVQTDRFRFGLAWFSGLARFFWLDSVFLIWLSFFRFGFGLVRFFRFQAYKTEPVSFFKILIGFFHGSVFLVIFFWFSRFNQFFRFFAHTYPLYINNKLFSVNNIFR
jgi:hypothetical protein